MVIYGSINIGTPRMIYRAATQELDPVAVEVFHVIGPEHSMLIHGSLEHL